MPLSRKKSCAPCRESKARCNRTMPECSRCALRHLTCVYDGRDAYRPAAACRPHATALLPPGATEDVTPGGLEADVLDSWGTLMENAGLAGTQDLDLAESEVVSGGAQLCYWPEKDGLPLLQDTGRLGTINDPWMLLQETEQDMPATVMQRTNPSVPNKNKDADRNTGVPNNHTLMKKSMFRTCIMCTILLGQVTSFPRLLIEGDRLPPFIHAPCHGDDGGGGGVQALECGERGSHQCLPRELAVCAGLVEMYYARTRGNADHVWDAVYRERARLQDGWAGFTSMQRLAALQSATVLLLLQASDSTTVETNDSGLLLNTVLSFATKMTQTHEWKFEPRSGATDRREWVFRESIRRVMALLHIVEALLDGFVYSTCTPTSVDDSDPDSGSGFRGVPLPSGRDLWEARTGRAWARSYRQHLADRSSDRALTVGDALDSGGVGATVGSRANPAGAARLSEVMRWAEGLDSLGMLVWMVLPFEDALARHRLEVV